MIHHIVVVVVHFLSFFVSFYCLTGLNLEKILFKGQVAKAQVFLLLSSIALGYLVAQFFLTISHLN
ncbi:MAG: DUF1146 family protein [Erysipelotrichaceae bacterium]|nr:DUF1146 family protein [Erysipelotrichaceae bacterium]